LEKSGEVAYQLVLPP
jgi:hypothetical protein